jgi:hypothetical protein
VKKKPVKGWRERARLPADFPMFHMTAVEQAMQEEIDELRERLGMPAEPVQAEKDPRQLDLIGEGHD